MKEFETIQNKLYFQPSFYYNISVHLSYISPDWKCVISLLGMRIEKWFFYFNLNIILRKQTINIINLILTLILFYK